MANRRLARLLCAGQIPSSSRATRYFRYHRLLFSRISRCRSLRPPHARSDTNLGGRVVLVTGASGGLGRILALACAGCGATVVLHGRIVRKLEALYDEILVAGHPEPTILPLDLATAKAEDFANVASALQAQHGRIDAIVHTAVQLGFAGPDRTSGIRRLAFHHAREPARPIWSDALVAPALRAAPDASGRRVHIGHARGRSKAYWGA